MQQSLNTYIVYGIWNYYLYLQTAATYTCLTISENVKYFGVEIDNKLCFEDHIDAKVSKARQRLYLVKQFKFLRTSDRFLN